MKITLAQFHKLSASNTAIRLLGCIVDTNVLFAASVPSDRLNEWAYTVVGELDSLGVPAFSNINIRSEFLELQRRVLVPEGLVSFYDERDHDSMSLHLKTQLKLLKSQKKQTMEEGRLFKFNDQQIKKYRDLFNTSDEADAWEYFCKDFLHPYLSTVWEDTVAALKLQFVGTRAIESREYFDRDPNWKDMTDIIGRFGIGSADAMIVNFFLCSKFPLMVTGDEDVAYAVERLSGGTKYILVPDELMKRSA